MIFSGTFVVVLNVADPIEFGTNAHHNALLRVRQGYERRCFKGCFIVAVRRVSRLSDLYINRTGTVGEATVDVEFDADCSRVGRGAFYAGVLLSRASHILMGNAVGPAAAREPIAVSIEDPSDVLAAGFVVPVVIGETVYASNQAQPAASARMLTCRRAAAAWRVCAGSPAVGAALVDDAWARLSAALAARRALAGSEQGSSVVRFFRMLLHSYSDAPPPAGVDVTGPLTSRAAVAEWAAALVAGSAWARPLDAPFDHAGAAPFDAAAAAVADPDAAPDAAAAAAANPDADDAAPSCTTASAPVVFTAIMTEAAAAIELLNDTADTYNDSALMGRQIGVWRIMRNAQLRRAAAPAPVI